jgi:GTP-sensing pleiotropic transcriptional regulator CodY
MAPYQKRVLPRLEVATMSANEWAEAIANAVQKKADKVPAGWHTADQVRDLIGLTQSNVSKKIRLLAKSGLVESKKFYIATGRGLYPEIHYKLIKKKK